MRRKDKEITDYGIIENILKEEPICRIAMCDWETPYVIPMVFGYQDGYMYLHSSREGKKIDLLRKNNRICFEVESKVQVVPGEQPCHWGVNYYSVIGMGKAYFVDEPEAKKKALDIMMRKFTKANPLEYSEAMLEQVEVIKIVVEEMTGKQSGY